MVAYDGDRQHLVLAGASSAGSSPSTRVPASSLWKTSVGQHNGHDADHLLARTGKYDELPRFPLTILPGILGGVETQMAVADGVIYAPDRQPSDHLQVSGRTTRSTSPRERARWSRSISRPVRSCGPQPFTAPAYGAATRLERSRLHDDVRRHAPSPSTQATGGDPLAGPAPRRHERNRRHRGRHAGHRRELPARRGPAGRRDGLHARRLGRGQRRHDRHDRHRAIRLDHGADHLDRGDRHHVGQPDPVVARPSTARRVPGVQARRAVGWTGALATAVHAPLRDVGSVIVAP